MLGFQGKSRQFTYTHAIAMQANTVTADAMIADTMSAGAVQVNTIGPRDESTGLILSGTTPPIGRYKLEKYHTIGGGQGSYPISQSGTCSYDGSGVITGIGTEPFQRTLGHGSIVRIAQSALFVVTSGINTTLDVTPNGEGVIGATTWEILYPYDSDFTDLISYYSGLPQMPVAEGIQLRGDVDANSVLGPKVSSPWGITPWTTSSELIWETHLRVQIGSTFAGLKLTASEVVGADDDAIYFRFVDDTDDLWHVIQSIAGVDTDISTTVPQVGNRTALRIAIDINRVARCYIDGVLVHTSNVLTDTDLIPMICGDYLAENSASTIIVSYSSISKSV